MTARRAARALLVLAAGAAASGLALAGATRAVLGSDWLLEQIDAKPESLFVTFTGARVSLLPGRIRFATLTLRSRDPNVEWEARLGDVTIDVALTSLAGRRFHAKSVRARSLAFRLRERLVPDEAVPARVARYPRIAGFADPPRRAPGERHEPPADPWRVALDDLDVAFVREIWIDSWRWTGEAGVSGGLFLRPGHEAEVLPSTLSVASGSLRWGEAIVSRATAGTVRASLPRFETREFPGDAVWKIMSGAASLDGTMESVPFLWPGEERPAETGPGTVRIRVAMRDGRGGGSVSARLEDARPLLGLVPPGPPKWLAGLVDVRDFCVEARIRVAPGLLAVSPVRGGSGTLALHADWRRTRGRTWGALLVEKGILALGFGLGNAAGAVRVLGASDWFDAEGRPGGLRTDQPRDSAGIARRTR